MPITKEDTKPVPSSRRRGRPRKHDSATERVRAFQIAHNLRRVTVDVPQDSTVCIRDYARKLREIAKSSATTDDIIMGDAQADKWLSSLDWKIANMRYADGVNKPMILTDMLSRIRGMVRESLGSFIWSVEIRFPDQYQQGRVEIAAGVAKDIELCKALVEANMRALVSRLSVKRAGQFILQ